MVVNFNVKLLEAPSIVNKIKQNVFNYTDKLQTNLYGFIKTIINLLRVELKLVNKDK